MWLLCCLAVTWLVHEPVFTHETSQINPNTKPDMEADFDTIAEEFLTSLSMAHTKTSRQKRDIYSDPFSTLTDDTGVYRLQKIVPISRLCYPAVYSQFLDVANVTYAVCAMEETDQTPAEVIVGLYENYEWRRISRWFVDTPHSLSAFFFNKYIYVLVADSERGDGADLVRIDIYTGERKVDHTVHSSYPIAISVWKMKVDGNYHMAIANSAGPRDGNNFNSDVYIYAWFGTYYDKYSSYPAYDVTDIEPFHIHGVAYLAIANYRKGKYDYKVDSDILKYSLNQKSWISHQKIRTYGAMDWEFFTLGSGLHQEFFLALANKEDDGASDSKSIVYKFVTDKFVPFQCLLTSGATSIASWSIGSEFILAVASIDAIHIYQYDGWRFVPSRTQYTQGSMSDGATHLVFHPIVQDSEQSLILSVSNPRHPGELSIFEFSFENENSLQKWNDESTSWCLEALDDLQMADMDAISKQMNDVVYINQDSITIDGNLYLDHGFEARKLETPELKELVTQEIYDSKMLLDLEDLGQRLKAVNEKLDSFDQVLRNAVRITGNQTIYSNLKFHDVSFDCESRSCRFDSIYTTMLNGEDISNWSQNLVFLDKEQNIDGTLMAENIVANNIIVQGNINGIDMRTLVTKSGNHTIMETKTFVNSFEAADVQVHGLVDGIKLSPTNVLLKTGDQNITGNLIFNDIETAWLQVLDRVNDIHLPQFYEDVVRSDQQSVITGEKTFHDIVIGDLVMNPGSTINGIDILDLWRNTMWKDGDQTIKAPMTFTSMTVHKDLHVPSGINRIQIPGPQVVDINAESVFIKSPQIFESSIRIARLNVMKSLNGLEAFESPGHLPQLDIMLRSADQVVTGKKTFHTIHLDANSFVKGTVNGIDLSEFQSMVLRRDSDMGLNRTWTFNNLVIKGPLSVNKVFGYNLDDLYERSLKLTDEELPNIIFKELLMIEELVCHDVNGIDIENDLVLRHKPQNITGRKIFEEIILEDNSIVLGTVNNLNMSFLTDSILRIGNQELKSKRFGGNVQMNGLTVTGSINNVPITELVIAGKEETLLNSRELVNVTFTNIEANNIEIAETVNNINIQEMMDDTMTYAGDETITGKIIVNGTIYVAENDHLTVDYVNDVDIDKLWDDAVLIDEPQVIYGTKTFMNSVTFNNLNFKTIDGVSDWDMQNWMLKDTPQVVHGGVLFSNGLSVNNLNVKGYINDINITHLDSSIVKKNEPNVIEGTVIFDKVISQGDVNLSGRIQGIDISEEAVTRSGEKVVSGPKTFTQDLLVGDAEVDGLVDGVSIQDLCQKTLLINKEKNITHLTIKGDVTLSGGGTVDGKISGVDLKELEEIAVTTEDGELNFSGKKTFENLTIEGPVFIKGTLGGVGLQLLDQTYMSLTRDQEINAPMEFEELNFKGTLSARKFKTANEKINEVEMSRLKLILRNDMSQTVTAEHYFDEITFSGDVFVAGTVNGLKLPEGVMRYNTTNYIQSPKIFNYPIHVHGDLNMGEGRQIQGVDVSEWYKKAVLNDGRTYEINGLKTFQDLTANDVRVNGLLDNLKISEEALLMTYGNQYVTGRKTILGDVEIKGSLGVDKFVNGVDLNRLNTNTLQRGRPNTITGMKLFSNPLTIQSLEAPTVAGVDVEELQRKINTQLDLGNLQNRLAELDGVISNMNEAIKNQAVVFQYYEDFQEFNIPTAYNWLYMCIDNSFELLLLSDNSSSKAQCSSIRIFEFNEERQEFIAQPKELLTSYAVSVESLKAFDTVYLFVANQNPNPACLNGRPTGEGNTTNDIYAWYGGEFKLHQAIETSPVVHMVVFQDGTWSCVVYIQLQNCQVYCSEGRNMPFQHTETLATRGGRKASIVELQDVIILAIAAENLDPSLNYAEDKKPVDIYIWNREECKFGIPMQAILSTYAQHVLLMNYANEYSSGIFLVIAEGRMPRVQNEPKLLIYRFEESTQQFQMYQQIVDYGYLDFLVLQTGELLLFTLDSYMGKTKLYQLKGASGFVHVDTVNSIGAVGLHAFIRCRDFYNVNHYLALAGPRVGMAQPSQGMDYAKILKSKVKGSRHFINL